MTFNSEDPPADARLEFCVALKTAREHKGITLAEIANATKIPAFLFAALERGDLRRWPKGLFRRSFFRDYVKTIGVPMEEACQEFGRLFPDEEGTVEATVGGWPPMAYDKRGQPPTVAAPKPGAGEAIPSAATRLVMDPAWHGPRSPFLPRLCVALIDAVTVVGAGLAIAWANGIDWPTTIAVVALTYSSVATAVAGRSPAAWIVARRQPLFDGVRNACSAFTAIWAPAAPPEEPDARAWYSDAHRVGPPRLRVRIKMPH